MTFTFWLTSDATPPGENASKPGHRRRPALVRDSNDPAHARSSDPVIDAIRTGDIAAFEQVYRSQYEGLVYFGRALLHSDDAARDVVAEVFLNVWRRRTEWRPSSGVRAYLYGAVRNGAMNVRRGQKRDQLRAQTAAAEQLTSDARATSSVTGRDGEHDDRYEVVWRVVDTLPERSRLIIQLRWRDGLDFGEIAEVLGISRASAHVLHARAIAMLRKQLGV